MHVKRHSWLEAAHDTCPTPPPDLGSITSSGSCQSKLRNGSSNLDACKSLCEQICSHVHHWNVAQRNLASRDNVAQSEEAQVEMLHAPVVLWVLANLNCRLVVQQEK
jgi:hypothetical protein